MIMVRIRNTKIPIALGLRNRIFVVADKFLSIFIFSLEGLKYNKI
jgi:hypothetical protein